MRTILFVGDNKLYMVTEETRGSISKHLSQEVKPDIESVTGTPFKISFDSIAPTRIRLESDLSASW